MPISESEKLPIFFQSLEKHKLALERTPQD